MGFVPDLRTISGDTLRAVSDGAIEQLAGRFDGLPRPLLAAIGAGDLAVEHLAVLREGVRKQVDGIDLDGQEIVAAAAGVAASVQNFAGELPRRLQEMAAELPGRVAALTRATGEIDPTAVVSTLEAYTEAAGVIYGGLARRGDRIWSDVRGASSRPGTVVDATPDRAAGTVRAVHNAPVATPARSTPRHGAAGPTTTASTRPTRRTSASSSTSRTAATPSPPTGRKAASAAPSGGTTTSAPAAPARANRKAPAAPAASPPARKAVKKPGGAVASSATPTAATPTRSARAGTKRSSKASAPDSTATTPAARKGRSTARPRPSSG